MMRLAICTILAAIGFGVVAVPSTKSLAGHFVEIGPFEYFSDPSTTLRTRNQSIEFCQASFGELAPVLSFEAYRRLLSRININGVYWIDGEDNANLDRFEFHEDNKCPGDGSYQDALNGANLQIQSKSCLVLVKPSTGANHRIEAVDCVNTRARVLCAQRIKACGASDGFKKV